MTFDWLPKPEDPDPLLLPGVYDGLSARLADMAGFRAVYASGGAICRSAGLPDIGLLSVTETVERIKAIVQATSLPVVADFETGFGGPANIRRAARDYVDAGVSAFHIEDQDTPKRCGALPGKRLIGIEEMSEKVRNARTGVEGSDVLVVARTDANDIEGLDRAIERVKAYSEAGAHLVYIEALHSRESILRVAEEVTVPKMISLIGGTTPPGLLPRELVELGFPLVIVPNDLQRAAVFAMRRALGELAEHGHTAGMAAHMITMADREVIARTESYLDEIRIR